jgi:dTDP-4-amino-4,6-dideoxygalactose transaminase
LLSNVLPRSPILDWGSFKIVNAPGISSVEILPHMAHTTSGRSAIYQALLQSELPASSIVLIPTYHCPTMVAPVLLANLKVAFYGIRADGLPQLNTIDKETARECKAMLVPHYFGIGRSLLEVRRWCDERNIVLIEDCAHCFFGDAGERPVGAWGDYATASLSKFLPVPEGGLLASAERPLSAMKLSRQGIKAQIKGWVDVVEFATQNNRFSGINSVLATFFRFKNLRSKSKLAPQTHSNGPTTSEQMMQSCDMGRIAQVPLNATMVLKSVLPRGRIITRRRDNFARYAVHFGNVVGARPAYELPSNTVAPYVFPLWVDDAERVYREVRARLLPVFRWDRIWPDTPLLEGDVGPQWSHHVLQLLCHQDLSEADVDYTAQAILKMLSTST